MHPPTGTVTQHTLNDDDETRDTLCAHIVTLVNKTHNEKTANCESYMYLEEELIERQHRNQRLVIDYAENETKKLRDEIDNLHRIVQGMTVPLWQF
jgi:hypothetical protein